MTFTYLWSEIVPVVAPKLSLKQYVEVPGIKATSETCRKNRNLMSISGHPMGSCKHEPKGRSAYSAPGHETKVHTTPEYRWRGLNRLARLATQAQAFSG
jgi:hypothetical protein